MPIDFDRVLAARRSDCTAFQDVLGEVNLQAYTTGFHEKQVERLADLAQVPKIPSARELFKADLVWCLASIAFSRIQMQRQPDPKSVKEVRAFRESYENLSPSARYYIDRWLIPQKRWAPHWRPNSAGRPKTRQQLVLEAVGQFNELFCYYVGQADLLQRQKAAMKKRQQFVCEALALIGNAISKKTLQNIESDEKKRRAKKRQKNAAVRRAKMANLKKKRTSTTLR